MKNIGSTIIFSIMFMLFCLMQWNEVVHASTIQGTCGENLTWEIKDGVLYVRGEGEIPNYEEGQAPWDEYTSEISSLVIEEGVTKIGMYAFHGCVFENVTDSITIPSTITMIRVNAFRITNAKVCISDLSAWCNIDFGSIFANPLAAGGLYLNGEPLYQITVPSDVEELKGTFCGFYDLANVIIPGNVKRITNRGFYDIPDLKAVVFCGDAPELIESDVFSGALATVVYYPEGNDTWTEDKMKKYGGNLTWKPYIWDDSMELLINPQDKSVELNDSVTMSTLAIGDDVTYQWQLCPKGSNIWKNIQNSCVIDEYGNVLEQILANSPRLKFSAKEKWAGKFRCIAQDKYGNQIISEIAELKIKNGYCSDYTPQLVEDTFRYLNDIYIEKYPEMALRSIYGSESDNEMLQNLADIIAEGYESDKEKADAVYDWINRNIVYKEESMYQTFPIDVFLSRTGVCLGYAELMQELLRKMGIPAVVGDGWRGDMEINTAEQLFENDGHAWCYAYVNGEWVFYDPLWGEKAVTNQTYLAKWYYCMTVEWVTPVYDKSQIPPMWLNTVCYLEGKYVLLNRKEYGADSGVNSVVNNLENRFEAIGENGQCEWTPVDASVDLSNLKQGDIICGIGWFENSSGIKYRYIYENGWNAYNVFMEYDGITYYITESGGTFKTAIPVENCVIVNGQIAVKTGYNGQILIPLYIDKYMPEVTSCTWSSENPDVATVDQEGNITALKEGWAEISCSYVMMKEEYVPFHFGYSFEIYVYENERVPDYSDNMLGHKHTYTAMNREATCARDGYVIHTCTYKGCADSYIEYNTKAFGHDYSEYVSDKNATLNSDGTKTKTCKNCGKKERIKDVGSKLEVSALEITTMPSKLKYNLGEELVLEDMVISLCYNNGTSDIITDYTVSEYLSSKLGEQTIVVNYNEYSTSFQVTVVDPEAVEETNTVPEDEDKQNDLLIWCLLASIIIAVGGFAGIMIWKKRHRKTTSD